MRRSSAILAALAVGLAVGPAGIACGGPDPGPGTSNRIELVLAGFEGHGLHEQIVDWEADHPGVDVVIEERDFDAHHEWLEEIATDPTHSPDLALVEISWSSYFRSRPELFIDLTTHGVDDLETDFLPWRWEHGASAEATIGLPTDVGGLAIAYRPDLLEAAGLPSDREALAALWPTWDAFVELGEQYRQQTGQPFIDDTATIFEAALNQLGTPSAALNTTDLFGDPAVQAAWQVTMAGIEADLGADLDGFTPEWTAAIGDGEFAVMIAPSWMLSYIRDEAPETYGLWDVASLPGGLGNWGGSMLTLPVGTSHPELAYDLARFLTAPSQQLSIFETHGNLPSAPELYDDPAIRDRTDDFFNGAPVGRIYTRSVVGLSDFEIGPRHREVLRAFRNALHDVDDGELASAAANAAVDAELAR